MEYHYRRPPPERRSAVAHWLHYIRATADRLSGGGLKPLPVRRSAVAYAYRSLSRPLPERRSAVAFVKLVFFVKFRQIACQLGCAGILVYYISLAAVL